MGNVSNLITKFLNLAIVLRSGWDVKLPLSPSVREELTFWKDNIRLMNGRPIGQRFSTNRTIVYCVASDLVVGWGRVNWVPRSLNKHARGCHYQVHCLR